MPEYTTDLRDPDPNVRRRGFTTLYTEVFPSLFKYARHGFPTLDEQACADAATNALLKMWEKIESGRHVWEGGDGPGASLNLLFHITRRQAANEYRAARRRGCHLSTLQEDINTTPGRDMLEVQEYRRSESESERVAALEERLQSVISQLPFKQWRIAKIMYNDAGQDLTIQEICQSYQKCYRAEISTAAAKSLKRMVEKKIIAARNPNTVSPKTSATPSNTTRTTGPFLDSPDREAEQP